MIMMIMMMIMSTMEKPQRLKQSPHVTLTHCFDMTTTNLWPDEARGWK